MKNSRKLARQKIKQAIKSEFEEIIDSANLTPIQEQITRLHFVKDWTICKIAMSLSCCESTIRKNLTIAYDKIAKI